jgi:hypothetical protein
MELTPVLGILILCVLAYLGHEEEIKETKRKLMSRSSLVNIRGVQAQWRLERVREIESRTKLSPCKIHTHQVYLGLDRM